jgi:AraC-like DNA-binding protein
VATSTNTTGRLPSSKGVLRPEEMARLLTFDETGPSPAAAPWVERVWSVTWDLPDGVEHVNSIVPHPSVSLTVERGDVDRDGAHGPGVWVTGVSTRRFDAVCRGRGGVVGVKFHAGGFTALTGIPAAELRDRSRLADGLVAGSSALADLPLDAHVAGPSLCALVEELAGGRGPDLGYEQVGLAVQHLQDPSVTRVDDLAGRCGLSVRGLQRLLRHYVGVGPKWMVARRRLHDAVATLDAGYDGSLADLAATAGWYDQNQFARDFTALVGSTPSAYRDRATAS